MFDSVLNNLYSDIMSRTASGTFTILAYSEIRLFRYIQTYSELVRHIQAFWGIIKAYSSLFRHAQNPMEPSRIHNLATFLTLAYL